MRNVYRVYRNQTAEEIREPMRSKPRDAPSVHSILGRLTKSNEICRAKGGGRAIERYYMVTSSPIPMAG